MGDSSSSKPGSRAGGGSDAPAKSPAASGKPQAPAPDPYDRPSGRIVHDDRGNAVWDWIKDTTRSAIDSTSRLLKKLEVPELTMEDTGNHSARAQTGRDVGGGYDPYGSSAPATKGSARREGSNSPRGDGFGNSRGAGNTNNNTGGGYDPYGKGVTRKPGRTKS